jgi:hypothetical protein
MNMYLSFSRLGSENKLKPQKVSEKLSKVNHFSQLIGLADIYPTVKG